MPSLTASRPRVKPERKPVEPVQVRASLVGGATRQDIIDGSAVLSIARGDASDTDEQAYWLLAVYEGERCTGFRLTKFGTGETYDLPRDLSNCDCPDHTFRPERPQGCRHMAALRMVLPTLAKDAPPRVIDRKTERDEATMT